MANLNGMGPNNQGPLTGRGNGNCTSTSTTASKIGAGLGMGLGLAWAGRRGFKNAGFRGRQAFHLGRRNKTGFQATYDTVEAYKSFLEEELKRINNQIDLKNDN